MSARRLATAIALLLLLPATVLADWPPEGIVMDGLVLGYSYPRFNETQNGDLLFVAIGVTTPNGGPFLTAKRMRTDGTYVSRFWRHWGAIYFDVVDDLADGMWSVSRALSPFAVVVQHTLPGGTEDPAWSIPGLGTYGLDSFANAVVPDDSGGAFVAWSDNSSGSPYPLLLMHFDPIGALYPAWAPAGVTLESDSYPVFGNPGLIKPGNGDIVALWTSSDSLRMQRITPEAEVAPGWPATGIALGPSRIGFDLEKVELFPVETGEYIAVWVDNDGGAFTIKALRIALDGTSHASWPAGGVSVGSMAHYDADIRAASDGENGVYIAWADPHRSRPRVTRVLADGSFAPGWPSTGIEPVAAGSPYEGTFAITHGESGGLLVAWADSSTSRLRWFLGDGTLDPAQPVEGREVHAAWPHGTRIEAMTSDGAGGAYVVWWMGKDPWDADAVSGKGVIGWHPYAAPLTVDPTLRTGSGIAMGPPHPNPSSGSIALSVTLPDASEARLELIDVTGRSVLERTLAGPGRQSVRLEAAGLRAGVYFVRVTQAGSTASQRVVVLD